MDQFTLLLDRASRGEAGAESDFVEAVHGELRRMAAREFRRENPSHNLQTTALVNETYLRLFSSKALPYHPAARTMRRIPIDHARSKSQTPSLNQISPWPAHSWSANSGAHRPDEARLLV